LLGSDFLQTLAELSIAFAGFSSIVVIFRRREADEWTPEDAFRYRTMLLMSLAALFYSLLPAGIHYWEVPDAVVWRSSSAVLSIFLAFVSVSGLPIALRFAREGRISLGIALIAALFLFGALLTQGFNLFGSPKPGPYITGVLVILASAGLSFFRLVYIKAPAA
jgi:hypothetical protein